MPVLIGAAVAYRAQPVFIADLFLLSFIGMTLVQFALTMLDDWHDYVRGTDTSGTGEKNPYTGGSGVLVDGTIKPREMITAVALFYIIATVIGLYLTYLRGIMVLYIILTGLFISIFYSLKPFQFAYRGLGEFMMLLGYGPTITLGSYYVQAQELSPQALFAGLIPGILMWTMMIVNEIPDYTEDRASGKKNLVVRFGKKGGVKMFATGLLTIYLYTIILILIGYFPSGTTLTLLSTPFAINAFRHLKKHYNNKIEVAAANRDMVKVYSTTTLLLTLGFLL
jgi:1,4-dihydroxy-2-naphthoate octaprenyltransferase